MSHRRSQSGFTLTEVLIAIVVTTVVVIVLTSFLMSNLQTSTLETNKANILREVELSTDTITRDVRLSANADLNNRNPDANNPSGSSNQFGWTSNSSVLVLATAATNTSGAIIFSDPANYVTTKNNIVYFVSNKVLYRRTIAANVSGNKAKTTCPSAKVTSTCPADKALLKNVTNFQVTYRDGSNNSVTPTNARSVEVSLTASSTQYHKTQSATYSTRMVFRND
jgi:prepilin-type N-terminal cleavage/methylation domain-containing protein